MKRADNEDVIDKEDLSRDRLLFKLVNETYNDNKSRVTALDDKASKIVVFVGIIVGLQSSFGSVLIRDIPPNNIFYNWYVLIYSLALILLIMSIIFGIFAYTLKRFIRVPKASTMIKWGKLGINEMDIIRKITSQRHKAIEKNANVLDEKIIFIKTGLMFFALGLVTILVFIVFLLYSSRL